MVPLPPLSRLSSPHSARPPIRLLIENGWGHGPETPPKEFVSAATFLKPGLPELPEHRRCSRVDASAPLTDDHRSVRSLDREPPSLDEADFARTQCGKTGEKRRGVSTESPSARRTETMGHVRDGNESAGRSSSPRESNCPLSICASHERADSVFSRESWRIHSPWQCHDAPGSSAAPCGRERWPGRDRVDSGRSSFRRAARASSPR